MLAFYYYYAYNVSYYKKEKKHKFLKKPIVELHIVATFSNSKNVHILHIFVHSNSFKLT